MNEVKFPPLPELGPEWTPYWSKVVHEKMQAYARAAIEANTPSVPDGWQLVPKEPTPEILRSMSSSKAVDDEGEFPSLFDLIDYSGENKTRAVMLAAYRAMLAASPQPVVQPVQQEPVGFVSPAQMEALKDQEGEFGQYLPMRKTTAGLFTLALYTHPAPQPERVPLTDEQIEKLHNNGQCGAIAYVHWVSDFTEIVRIVEAAHNVKKD